MVLMKGRNFLGENWLKSETFVTINFKNFLQ